MLIAGFRANNSSVPLSPMERITKLHNPLLSDEFDMHRVNSKWDCNSAKQSSTGLVRGEFAFPDGLNLSPS